MINSTIREMIDKLNKYTELYDRGRSPITDKEWDDLYFELKKMEERTGIIYPDSPTQNIHFNKVSELNKVEHTKPMLSLAKTKDKSEITKYFNGKEIVGMFKLDGLSCRLTYINGELTRGETRGNGIMGEDITHNVNVINNIPKFIKTTEEIVEIDGEVICRLDNFEQFKETYQNPRNFASGSIRLLDSKECASRKLSFVAWDLIKGYIYDSFIRKALTMEKWGFDVVPRISNKQVIFSKDCKKSKSELEELATSKMIEMLDEMPEHKIYPIDGYVFRLVSQKEYDESGRTEHHFSGAMAYKFYDEEYETELLDIEWGMGRTGVLTPVAIFKPVDTGDSIVERASLHNFSIMKETLGEYPEKGQKIWIVKRNQIIPNVERAEKNNDKHDHILENGRCLICPICGKPTEIVQSDSGVENVVCGNPACEGKLANRIDHYAGIKGLNIKGLSIKTIEKLMEWGWIETIKDIYYLNQYKNEWIKKDGFGLASVEKILNAIEDSKNNVELSSFISAIGIPLVGKSIAKEIVKYYPTWDEFREAVGGDWTEFNGFGYEISRSINNFDYTEADEIAGILAFKQPDTQNGESPAAANIKDKTFVITGKVTHYKNRDELKTEIETLGGKVASSVSSKTDYLINNDNTSTTSKNLKAKELGIPIITEEEYIKMIG